MFQVIFALALVAHHPSPQEILTKVAVTKDTWRTVEEYEYAQERDKLLYLYSAMLYKNLRDEEWEGIERFTDEHPGCDTLCVVGMVKEEMDSQ
jgi:hypothetical protein